MKYIAALLGLIGLVSAQEFTSIFNITATPDQVVNTSSVRTPGQPGARGQFNYAINSKTNTICYDITLYGVSGNYSSPARTATHIHEAALGRSGPPRIAFPNPVGDDTIRNSKGCLTGPFTTGIKAADNVTDTGAGFTLDKIEANPGGFFTDSHTSLFLAGVVRGQLNQSYSIIPSGDGSVITTATLTSTKTTTITACPVTVTNCPYTTKPLVTVTAIVYTTTCPVSALPGYTSSAAVTRAPDGTPTTTIAGTGVATRSATASVVVFTGAANAKRVGGVMVAAGLVAALL